MLVVQKYDLLGQGHTTLMLPASAKILCASSIRDQPFLWALVDPSALQYKEREFLLVPTGYTLITANTQYISSFTSFGEETVYHLFEIIH